MANEALTDEEFERIQQILKPIADEIVTPIHSVDRGGVRSQHKSYYSAGQVALAYCAGNDVPSAVIPKSLQVPDTGATAEKNYEMLVNRIADKLPNPPAKPDRFSFEMNEEARHHWTGIMIDTREGQQHLYYMDPIRATDQSESERHYENAEKYQQAFSEAFNKKYGGKAYQFTDPFVKKEKAMQATQAQHNPLLYHPLQKDAETCGAMVAESLRMMTAMSAEGPVTPENLQARQDALPDNVLPLGNQFAPSESLDTLVRQSHQNAILNITKDQFVNNPELRNAAKAAVWNDPSVRTKDGEENARFLTEICTRLDAPAMTRPVVQVPPPVPVRSGAAAIGSSDAAISHVKTHIQKIATAVGDTLGLKADDPERGALYKAIHQNLLSEAKAENIKTIKNGGGSTIPKVYFERFPDATNPDPALALGKVAQEYVTMKVEETLLDKEARMMGHVTLVADGIMAAAIESGAEEGLAKALWKQSFDSLSSELTEAKTPASKHLSIKNYFAEFPESKEGKPPTQETTSRMLSMFDLNQDVSKGDLGRLSPHVGGHRPSGSSIIR